PPPRCECANGLRVFLGAHRSDAPCSASRRSVVRQRCWRWLAKTFCPHQEPQRMASIEALGYTPFFSAQFELLPDHDSVRPARVSAESHGLFQLVGCDATLGELTGKLRAQLKA